jgi:hypothetical protein
MEDILEKGLSYPVMLANFLPHLALVHKVWNFLQTVKNVIWEVILESQGCHFPSSNRRRFQFHNAHAIEGNLYSQVQNRGRLGGDKDDVCTAQFPDRTSSTVHLMTPPFHRTGEFGRRLQRSPTAL